MKQFKVLTVIAIAGLLMMVSCAKDNAGNGSGTPSTESKVKIQVVYNHSNGSTRADANKIADQTDLDFTVGHIFFAESNGQIHTHVGIGNTAGGVQVSKADLTGGEAVIEGISTNATKCYIVMTDAAAQIASSTGITGNLKGQNINVVKAYAIEVGNINNTDGDVANVPLYGEGTVNTNDPGSTSGNKNYTATVDVEINALASRLQIGKVSAKDYTYTDGANTTQTVSIDAFTVEGIYINNFYEEMTVGATVGTVIDGGADVTAYTTTGSTAYSTGGVGEKLTDQLAIAASNTPLAVVPATKQVWAYNLFPGASIPAVVIKLSEVKFTDTANGTQTTVNNQFLTVKSFKYAIGHANAGQDVVAFAANNIYTLSDIQFDYTDLTSVPYEETMTTLVTVDMMKWIDNTIEWKN